MPLKDLVVYLGNLRVTGTLRLERAEVRKEVVIRDGQVVNASSNLSREFFGQFLINMGHLSEDQFTKAHATQRETRIFLGKILVMIGLVTQQTVQSTLSLKFRETLLDAFRWEQGEFVYEPALPGQKLDSMDVSVDLLDISREGEFRETAWKAIRAAFPSGAVRLDLHTSKLAEPFKPGSLDERIAALIAEDMSIDDMALTLHASDFFLYQRLYALYRLDALTVRDEGPTLVPASEPLPSVFGTESSTAEILAAAHTFLEDGDAKGAEALARRAHELSPSPQSATLLKAAELSLLSLLRNSLLEPPQVPVLQVTAAHLKSLTLSAPERYLLSRIDGERDVGAIVQVSPLQELDALKFFQRFVDTQLVSLRDK